jgi:hypothetical protein
MAKTNITYQNGSIAGVESNNDSISCLVIAQSGITVSNITGMTAGDGFSLIQLSSLPQAEAAGITATLYPVINYQISCFYEQTPATLYLAILSNPTGSTYTELPKIAKQVEGTIKQFGIFDTRTLSTTILANINTQLTACKTAKMPAIGIVGMNSNTLSPTGYTDLSSAAYSNTAVMLGQDGDSTLYTSLGISIPDVGAVLGSTAKAGVNVSPAWFRDFTYDNITTNPALGNGVAIKTLDDSYLETNVFNKNYMGYQKIVGSSSVFLAHSKTATSVTDDYRSIELNRTIFKASRSLNLYASRELNSPIELDEQGWIAAGKAAELENYVATGLKQMKANGEISAFKVYIERNQNLLVTGNLQIVCKIVPYATASEISISLGYAITIA